MHTKHSFFMVITSEYYNSPGMGKQIRFLNNAVRMRGSFELYFGHRQQSRVFPYTRTRLTMLEES